MSSEVYFPTAFDGRDFVKIRHFNGQHLRYLVEAGLTWLKTNQQMVNSLNVFPVPDGDTGTNMVLTMQSAYNEIINSKETNIGKMAHMVAQGALMGARGNSGVILSQLWRGFARGMDDLATAEADVFVKALASARDTAYKGVVRPVEGTILTVAKDMAAEAAEAIKHTSSFYEILEKVVAAGDASVERTPELLPILKQAGVVDSGGKGLFFIIEGMLRFMQGLSLETPLMSVQPLAAMQFENTMDTVEPGQDYEVVVDFRPETTLDLDDFYEKLSEMGTSIQVGEGEGIYRMHIHVPTENRYLPIDYTMSLGTITKVSMENLLAQMADIEERQLGKLNLTPVQPGQIGVVAISPGAGLSRIFASLGASAIVEGGQTMNPSTEEILQATNDLPTDKIIILPNNKNILMAAQNAAAMTVKQVKVVPTRSTPQGLSAMLRLDHNANLACLAEEMTDAIDDVETGEITIATRSVEINGVQVREGQVIALLNGALVESTDNITAACLSLLAKGHTEERERITFFYGNNIQRKDVDHLVDEVRKVYPQHEIELHNGAQPHYQLILAIE